MQIRITAVGIIVENKDSVESVNGLLCRYSQHIIKGLGFPYKKRKANVISIVVDAPQDTINVLSGKLGRLQGINSKTLHSSTGSW